MQPPHLQKMRQCLFSKTRSSPLMHESTNGIQCPIPLAACTSTPILAELPAPCRKQGLRRTPFGHINRPLLNVENPQVPRGARPPSPVRSAGSPWGLRLRAVSRPHYKRWQPSRPWPAA